MKNFNPPLVQISAYGLIPYIQALGTEIIGCELGVCRGHNLRYFLDKLPEISRIYCIDPWKSYFDGFITVSQSEVDSWKSQAVDLVEPYRSKVIILEKSANEAVIDIHDNELDYIFIDGDHSYSHVLSDIRNYWQKVKPGGIFSGHDYHMQDVKNAVADFRKEMSILEPIQFTEQNVWFWTKK